MERCGGAGPHAGDEGAKRFHVAIHTPAAIVEKLNAAINAELKAGDMRQTLLRLGAEVKAGTPSDFAAFVADEAPKWAEVIKSSGMKLE